MGQGKCNDRLTIDDLPLEMLVEIFQKLGSEDLPLAAQVNPEWHYVIHRMIGFDVQIGPETISKNSIKIYDHLHQIKMHQVSRCGIRNCTVGENFAESNRKFTLKYPFLLKSISFGGPVWPSYVEGLLVQNVPNNLSTLQILLNSMISPMAGLLSQLNLPKLKSLKIKDTGIVVPKRKMKTIAIQNAVKNIQALLTVHFPSLTKFKFELIQTSTVLSIQEEVNLTRGIFSFLGINRYSLLSLKLRLFKKGAEMGDAYLPNFAGEVSNGARLETVKLHLIPDIDNTALDSTLVFLQRQRFLKDVTITGDKVPFGNIAKSLTANSFHSLTEIQMSKRFVPTGQWDAGYSLNCELFENCHSLRYLSCQITPTNQFQKTQIHNANCSEVGFYPMITNVKFLPVSLESVTLESFAIPRAEMMVLLTKMPRLTEAYILGNWVGGLFGSNVEILKSVLQLRTMKEVIFGPFLPSRQLTKGFDNEDPDEPKNVQLVKNCPFIHLILNDNGYYENA